MGTHEAPVVQDPIDQVLDGTGEPSCSACPHTWSEHDALGRRFCAATHDHGWDRGCICR
ncbi:RGCVC family protein [Actinomycetospora sp. NBC_00405]|jgi:hypothetical protein|uniref:RGCVC family protein n=1 Tax=Actinomycetospora sp. NBC_00405 TaxID=2975952 RepID=UPI002E1A1ADB